MRPESIFSVVVLPAPFGPEEADELALGDREADVLRRRGLLELAVEQALHAAPEAGLLLVGAEDPGQVLDFDHGGHDGSTVSRLDRTQLRIIEHGVADEARVERGPVGEGRRRARWSSPILKTSRWVPSVCLGAEEPGEHDAGGHRAADRGRRASTGTGS